MAKNVLLIGATGFVGSAILNELVNRGHKVTAVVRNVEKVAKNDLVEAVQADVADVDAIAKLAEGKDAIISAYNPGWMNPDIARLITENYPKILDAAKKSSVERLLIVGGAGTLFCAPGLRVVDSGAIPEELSSVSSFGGCPSSLRLEWSHPLAVAGVAGPPPLNTAFGSAPLLLQAGGLVLPWFPTFTTSVGQPSR